MRGIGIKIFVGSAGCLQPGQWTLGAVVLRHGSDVPDPAVDTKMQQILCRKSKYSGILSCLKRIPLVPWWEITEEGMNWELLLCQTSWTGGKYQIGNLCFQNPLENLTNRLCNEWWRGMGVFPGRICCASPSCSARVCTGLFMGFLAVRWRQEAQIAPWEGSGSWIWD